MECREIGDDSQIVLCDHCDRGVHLYCMKPPLKEAPEDEFLCRLCVKKGKKSNAGGGGMKTSKKNAPAAATPQSTARKTNNEEYEDPMDMDQDVQGTVALRPSSKKKKTVAEVAATEAVVPFAGRLAPADASILKTRPSQRDKDLFESAKKDAAALAPKPRSIVIDRGKEDNQATTSIQLPQIEKIVIGDSEVGTWYMAPYPEEYNLHETLYLCEFCLKYMKSPYVMKRHMLKCPIRHPPGDEIYRDGIISIFEVDGRKNKIYCQNLCLLAKMFLDHKTLYYDVEPFLFYVMTEVDEKGCHFVGYFSKEKRSSADYNLSCILTLPSCHRKGYGQLLIDFSYLLSRKEGKVGSPEKPLSDLGLLTYRSYWRTAVLEQLLLFPRDTSIQDISDRTGMMVDDIVTTLQDLDMIYKDARGRYVIALEPQTLQRHFAKVNQKNYPRIQADCLHWIPFVLTKR